MELKGRIAIVTGRDKGIVVKANSGLYFD